MGSKKAEKSGFAFQGSPEKIVSSSNGFGFGQATSNPQQSQTGFRFGGSGGSDQNTSKLQFGASAVSTKDMSAMNFQPPPEKKTDFNQP